MSMNEFETDYGIDGSAWARDLFAGASGTAHTLIDAFGEPAVVRRLVGAERRDGWARTRLSPVGGEPEYVEEKSRFVRSSTRLTEGALASGSGGSSARRREERIVGLLSAVGVGGAPRVGTDEVVVGGLAYRLTESEPVVVAGRHAAYRIVGVRS